MPTLSFGDEVELVIAATVSAITDTAVIWGDTNDFLVDGNNCIKADLVDIAGSAVSATTAQLGVNVVNWNNTVVASPATAGVPDVNVKNINNVAAATPGASGGMLIAGTNAATTISGLTLSGANAVTSTPAKAGLTIAGGAASTSAGGTAAAAVVATGGAGAASTNGAGAGVTATAGGTTTVSGNDGVIVTATGNGNGTTLTHAGSGVDLNAATTSSLAVNATKVGGQTASASGTVTFPNATLASTTNITAGTITTVTNLTNAPTSGDLTATMKTSVTTACTASTPTAAAVTGAVGSVTARVTANTDQWAGGTIPAPTVTGVPLIDLKYILGTILTETSGQIAAAFKKFFNIATPASTMDHLVLIDTATTATNLTNAPTSGDFTATMKSSLNSATPASITGAVGSVTGNVGGNVAGSVASVTAAVTVGTINASASNIKKNTAINGYMFVMTSSTTHSPQTGLTVSGTVSHDGGAFGPTTNSATEIGNGWYTINLSATDLNGNNVALRFTAASADDCDISFQTQP